LYFLLLFVGTVLCLRRRWKSLAGTVAVLLLISLLTLPTSRLQTTGARVMNLAAGDGGWSDATDAEAVSDFAAPRTNAQTDAPMANELVPGDMSGMMGGMGGMGGGGMGGGGFFSIPAERTLKVPFVSACLNHGKAEPNPTAQYRMVRVSDYTQDPVLSELITMVGTGRVDQQSAQAAIWTRTDNMSWEQLSTKTVRGIHGFRRYFQPGQIAQGQQLVATAETRVREQGQQAPQTNEPAGGRAR
ncbi:MAG: hypothetical protein ACK5UD_08345, partial [Planctomyces sp.]